MQSLTAALKKGSTVVGKGKLGAFAATKRVTLKLAKTVTATGSFLVRLSFFADALPTFPLTGSY